MVNMDHLYNDPDWMLQAGMADIEHEQFMYDQIMYGNPSDELSATERSKLMEGLGTELYDYDEMALMGLRKHTMEGPMRYLYDEEQKKGRLKTKNGHQYWGQTDMDDPFDPDDDPRTRIDLNLPEIIKDWEKAGKPGTLQSFISDVYRHEYKHPLWDQHLGIREKETDFWGREKDELSREKSNWAFREKYQAYDPNRQGTVRYSPGEVQHIPIYATGALYGQNPYIVRDAYKAVKKYGNMGQKELGWGGNLMRTARHEAERAGMLPDMHTGEFLKHDQHPHKYPDQLNRGGIASLV